MVNAVVVVRLERAGVDDVVRKEGQHERDVGNQDG